MSRREYPVADYYEERERDFYGSGRRRGAREYAEFDEEVRTTRVPDFLREGYGQSTAGALVRRGHTQESDRRTEVDVDIKETRSTAERPRTRVIEKEELIIRDDRAPPRRKERSPSDFSSRRSVPDLRSRRGGRDEEIEIDIRRREDDVKSVRSTRPREIERDEIEVDIRREEDTRSVRSRRPREVEETNIDIDIHEDTRSVRSRRPREVEKTDIDIDIRRESDVRSVRSARPPPPPPAAATRVEEEIIIRRGEGSRPPPPRSVRKEEIDIDIRESSRPPPPRSVKREEIDIDIREERGRPAPPPPKSVRGGSEEDLDINISHSHSRGRGGERIRIREQSRGPPPREQSMPPANLVRREHEEFVIRRRRPPSPSPSPSPPPIREDKIVIRRREKSPSPPPPPPPEPEPAPPPVLAPIIRPPIHQEIHQEIITHHRHIDHGVERARSPTPPPPPPPPAPAPVEEKQETLEIDIRRKEGGRHEEEEIEIRQTRRRASSSPSPVRARSLSQPRRRYYDDELEAEADFYNRKALERGFAGEAYNGATRDWGLVDVPPGTERVRMEGAGGGGQEITWQRYNGNRRSKFISGDREFDTGYGLPAPAPSEDRQVGPVRKKPDDMWTEVTKDLVVREAIDTMGYEFEETEGFFYVMEYLKYEDVLQLVEISDDIRRARRRRLREIEWERRAINESPRGETDYYEREVIIDRRERRG